jgi:uncharacterized coiled-coil DUF342 family protein
MGSLNIKTLGNNIEKVEKVIKALESVKTNWPDFVKSDQTFDTEFNNDIDKLISDLKTFQENLEKCGKKADQYADWVV